VGATLAKELTVRELARERGVSTRTIQRWLHRLNERTGGKTVYRDGNGPTAPLKTTLRALREANPRLVETRDLEIEQVAVELRRVNGARVQRSVQTAFKELSADVDALVKATLQTAVRELVSVVDERVKSFETRASKQLDLFQNSSPLRHAATDFDTRSPLSK